MKTEIDGMLPADGIGILLKPEIEQMEFIDLIKDRDSLNAWIKGWQDDCRTGRHIGIRMIHDFAEKVKHQYCTNDVWNPGARVAYDLLLNAADQCRQLYKTVYKTRRSNPYGRNGEERP